MTEESINPNAETKVYSIPWKYVGKYLKKGMKMISVMPGPGAQTTMLAVVPEALVAELEKRYQPKRKPSLRDVLVDLAGWASYQRGEVKRAVLSGGLGIDVICGVDGMWRLQIWRERVEPSLKEWQIVLKSWPTPLGEIPCKRFVHKDRQYLRGEWSVTYETENIPGVSDADETTLDRPSEPSPAEG